MQWAMTNGCLKALAVPLLRCALLLGGLATVELLPQATLEHQETHPASLTANIADAQVFICGLMGSEKCE